jgi:hypothetical protein
MLWIRTAAVLILSCGALRAAALTLATPPVPAPVDPAAEKPAPLLEERKVLRAEVAEMERRINAIRARERDARLGLRAAVGERKNLLDPANVDEETATLIVRVQKLERELLALKTELKERLKNHPDTVAREKRMKAVGDSMQTLRADRTDIQKLKVKKVGRLRVIEHALAERRKAAAEVKAAAEKAAAAEVTTNE